MSLQRTLYNKLEGAKQPPVLANLLVANMPAALLADDFARELCVIVTTELAKQYNAQQYELSAYNITDNA